MITLSDDKKTITVTVPLRIRKRGGRKLIAAPATSPSIRPPFFGELLEQSGYVSKVIAACKAAMEREPDKVRFRFQYARALLSKPDIQDSEIDDETAAMPLLLPIPR